jgi:hypothetical protein
MKSNDSKKNDNVSAARQMDLLRAKKPIEPLPQESTNPAESQTPDQDKFSIANIRLPQNFHDLAAVKQVRISVGIGKPGKSEFFMAHPGESYSVDIAMLEFEEDRKELYVLSRALWQEHASDMRPKRIVTLINRQGGIKLWPIGLPGEDGRINSWNESAFRAVDLATSNWVKLTSNMANHAYEAFVATGNLPDPVWPEETFSQLLELAFRDRYIDSTDHPVLRKLRGEV